MKNNMIVQSLGLAAMLAVSAGAFAHGSDDGSRYGNPGGFPAYNNGPASAHPAFQESLRLKNEINERQDTQMDRILNGMYDKRINPAEFRKLMNEQLAIRGLERSFLRDGFLTRLEYQKLDAALDAANRNIFREGHDAQGRPGYGGWYSGHYNGGWNR